MNNLEILKRLYKDYTKQFVKKILISILFTIVIAASTSSIAWLLDPAIKKLFIEKNNNLLLIIPSAIVLAFFLKGTSVYIAKVIMINVAEDIKAKIQSDMTQALINADSDYINKKHSGKFVSNLIYDTSLIVNLVSTAILNLFKDSLTLLGLLGVMFYQNWKLSLISIVMIPLASLAARSLGKRIGKVSTEAQEKSGALTTHLLEIFKNHRVIKIFQRENYESQKILEFINGLKEKAKKISIVFVRATPIMEFFTGVMIAILIYSASLMIINGDLLVNNFFSFLAAMMLAYQPVRSLATLNIAISQGLSAAKRILPIIDIKNQVNNNLESKDLHISIGEIEFKNVKFNYNKNKNETEDLIRSINLKFIGGEMNALVGLSGAGKTTILNLIPRFYNCDSGDITIDNQSIYNVNLNSLRKKISFVSQDTTLFDDTVKNNIKYANLKSSDEEVFDAAEKACATEFINKLPKKFDTLIGENGIRLSGGEKQRLSIARAILKQAPIVLLDEATSSLDADTENKIQKALNYLTKNKTTIVIAHRLSTILNSKKIFVIDKGLVVSEGSHNDLLAQSEIYNNFYQKQIQKS